MLSFRARPGREEERYEKARSTGVAGPAIGSGGQDQTEKDDPQPQVVEALGLRITNWDPDNPSV
ncbi:hypothetical protein JCM19379_14570 [Methyloparacoccus murrellii]